MTVQTTGRGFSPIRKIRIGWSFWPWKKMNTKNTPYSINKPQGWDEITAYTRAEVKPSRVLAQKAFDELAENIKIEKCVYYPDVANAIFRRVPGKVEAENYGHRGLNRSYFVRDTVQKAAVYRTSEPVPVEPMESAANTRIYEQCLRLGEKEWTVYEINSLEPRTCKATVKVKTEGAAVSWTFTLNGRTKESHTHGTGWV